MDKYEENREKVFELKKAIWKRHERMKQIDPNLRDPRLLSDKIDVKGYSKKQREHIEKALLEEWAVEGKQETLEPKETKQKADKVKI